jgi:hypothetical protein
MASLNLEDLSITTPQPHLIPNIILRGWLTGTQIRTFIQEYIHLRPEEPETILIQGEPCLVYSWGYEFNIYWYRDKSAEWWEIFLNDISNHAGFTSVRIVVLVNVGFASLSVQQVIRKHAEQDHKLIRYILTCRPEHSLERSLESRCVCFTWNTSPEAFRLPEITSWEEIHEFWLSDLAAEQILEAMFREYADNPEMVHLWAYYSNKLRFCYQELTILKLAWKSLTEKLSELVPKPPSKKLGKPSSQKSENSILTKEEIPKHFVNSMKLTKD